MTRPPVKKAKPKRTTKRPKLADPHGGRSIAEWIGQGPDSRVPDDVQLRVWQRQDGRDPDTGVKMRKSEAQLDHDKPLHAGGQNRESNLVWRLVGRHKDKTAKEAAARAKADRQAKAAAGIKRKPRASMKSQGFEPPPEKEKGKGKSADPFPNLPKRICGRIIE